MNYSIDERKPFEDGWTNDSEKNPYIVESAGYVPLEVRFKQFEQNGIRAQFSESDFDGNDLRDIYLSADTCILPGDDIEDICAKLTLQAERAAAIKNAKLGVSVERSETETPSPSTTESNSVKGEKNE